MMDLRNALLDDERLDVEPAPVPADNELKRIAALAAQYLQYEKEVENLQSELAKKQAALKALREADLPLAMAEAGTRRFDLTDGSSVELKEGVAAGIAVANREAAHTWLEKNGAASLVKHVITISFGKSEEAWAKKFLRDLAQRKRPLAFERKDSVHPQTLGKFVRDRHAQALADGESPQAVLPYDLLGVHEYRYAEVTRCTL